MAARWYIVHGGKERGPLTAEELRRGVSRGEIDPFDLVFQEGSTVRRVLIDVDEIFDTAAAVYQVVEAEPLAFPAISNPEPTRIARPVSNIEQPLNRAQGGAVNNAPERESRRYFVNPIVGTPLGPMRAREVAQAFRDGRVSRLASVSKDRGGSRVPIQKFVDRYEENRPGGSDPAKGRGLRGIGRGTKVQPMRIPPEGKRPRTIFIAGKEFPLPLVSLFFAAIAILVVVWTLHAMGVQRVFGSHWFGVKDSGHAGPVPAEATQREPVIDGPSMTEPRREVTEEARRSETTPANAAPTRTMPVIPTTRPIESRSEGVSRVQRVKTPPVRRVRTPGPSFQPPPRPPSVFAPVIPPRAPIIQSPPLNRPIIASPPRSGLASQVGQVVTLAGARYSAGALAACGMKCRLPLMASSGESVTAVFFKGAFEDKLQAGRGVATVRGLLKQEAGGLVIYLQQ